MCKGGTWMERHVRRGIEKVCTAYKKDSLKTVAGHVNKAHKGNSGVILEAKISRTTVITRFLHVMQLCLEGIHDPDHLLILGVGFGWSGRQNGFFAHGPVL